MSRCVMCTRKTYCRSCVENGLLFLQFVEFVDNKVQRIHILLIVGLIGIIVAILCIAAGLTLALGPPFLGQSFHWRSSVLVWRSRPEI